MRESLGLIVVLAIVAMLVLGLGQQQLAQTSPASLAAAQSAQAVAASQASANQMLTGLWVIIGLPVLALAVVGGLTCLTTARRWMRRWARLLVIANADDEQLPQSRPARRVASPTRMVQVISQTPPPLVISNTPTVGWGWDADED